MEYYLVTIKDLSYLGTRLRTECQSPMGWPLSFERSLVSLEKIDERNENEK